MIRTSTRSVAVPPTRSELALLQDARGAWPGSRSGISPTSSRKRVPPSARSKPPVPLASAPVKAPRSWPNSSRLEQRVRDGGAVDGARTAPRARGLAWWIARATQLLAGAALPGDEHRRVGGRHLGGARERLAEGGRPAEDPVEAVALVESRLQRFDPASSRRARPSARASRRCSSASRWCWSASTSWAAIAPAISMSGDRTSRAGACRGRGRRRPARRTRGARTRPSARRPR